jgi:hypothetical protein
MIKDHMIQINLDYLLTNNNNKKEK